MYHQRLVSENIYKNPVHDELLNDRIKPLTSVFLHEVLSHSPHACPFPVNIHGDCGGKACELDTANREKRFLCSIVVKPGVEEERENEAVEDIYRQNELVNAVNEMGINCAELLTLGKIECDQCLPCILAVTIDSERD